MTLKSIVMSSNADVQLLKNVAHVSHWLGSSYEPQNIKTSKSLQ